MSKVKEDTAKVDNTAVVKPKVFERLRVTPRKYELVDLGGTPSNDTRTPAERNKDYLHPIKGAKERFKASMSNETNPLVGIERTILPSAAGAALVTTPIALAKGAGYGFGIDKLTGGWGNMVERTTGIPSEIAQYTNPGAIIGGAAGYRLDQKNLLSKFIKGDADLAWNPINKNHWIFNKEARTASNIGMAVTNRLAPFLQGVEKLPLKVAAYKTAKRTKGNASVTLSEIKGNPSDYAGASILGGGNLEGRNLVAQYIFGENPIIKRVFFNKATSNIKPISNNEAKRGFSHGDRYEQLYPGIYNRRYEMRSVVPQGRPLKFSSSEFAEYAGNNPVGKVIGKEGDMIMRTGDTEFMVFRNPGTNYVGPIDDVGGHVIKLQMDKGKLKQTSQDMWKFNPADYAKRWNESPNAPDQVRLTKQAALMDKVGTPFILQQSNPIWIEGRSVRQAMKVGGKFTFKKSPAVKDAEKLNGKRDMRKKFVKSSRPTYKRRIRKGQVGMRFVSYVPVNNPTIDYTDITNPINPFSEYYIPTTYNTEQALVVPEREDSKSDTVEETPVVASKPIAEPVVNKPVASKVVNNTANSTWSSPYKDRSKWAADLTNAYKRAGITNDNAIRMLVSQDALESAWGRSAQGKFNFGNLTTGAKWKGDYVTGNDKNAKGEAIKQKFRSYNSMDEYAADKVQFLKRLYDFEENDDINKFVAKLTGSNKGKRRYAEARNYAKLLTGVYNGISKGQNGLVVQRRDAIKDYTPQIPLSPIKRTYMPTQLPVLSQDNRTGWEKEVSEQIKEEQARNNNLYNNQHIWNWSAPFNNTRTTKSNAGAMFDFNKSAAMSTFATGMGIANPTATATSMVGSLVGAGIGNKVAGDKGALVGGFIGGMVNPKLSMRFNKKNNSSAIKQPIVVAKESKLTPEEKAGMPKGERNQPIKSKLDWKNWSKGGPISKEHLAEYAQIERDARRRGYWLMTSDGKAWEGDPRTWVQLMSKDGNRFKKGKFPSNDDLYYSGINGDDIIYDDYNGRLWASSNPATARSYTNSDDRVMTIGVPNNTKAFEMDAQGKYWQDLPNPYTGKKNTTDEIVDDVFNKGYDIAFIKNVRDNGPNIFKGSKYGEYFIGNEGTNAVINRKVPRKSLVGNNGDFNINNPNLYKVLAPFLLIGGMDYDKWIY